MQTIGKLKIDGKLVLAPMAGVADLAFREQCIANGASYTYTEMISAKALVYDDSRTKKLLELSPLEKACCAVQIFGSDPDVMGEAAHKAVKWSGAPVLDINMGCPTPKIVNNGDGSALMKNLPLAEKVIMACVKSAGVPVTIKMRLGYEENSRNAVAFAQMAEQAGASAICVHGRTREAFYSGKADWDAIAAVKQAVKIPVIANGDVFQPGDAQSILQHTGADFAMIGRGALGRPWIFKQAIAALDGRPVPEEPPVGERLDVAKRQIERAADRKGEHTALLEARKHLIWYLKGIRGAKPFKEKASKVSTLAQLYAFIEEAKQGLKDCG